VRAMCPQHGLLCRRGKQPVSRHANTLTNTTDIVREVKRRFFRGLTASVPTPRNS
jgi:hypothetical protein